MSSARVDWRRTFNTSQIYLKPLDQACSPLTSSAITSYASVQLMYALLCIATLEVQPLQQCLSRSSGYDVRASSEVYFHAAASLVDDLKPLEHMMKDLHCRVAGCRSSRVYEVQWWLFHPGYRKGVRGFPGYNLAPSQHSLHGRLSYHSPGCVRYTVATTSSWGRGSSLAKGRSLFLPFSCETSYRVKQTSALQLSTLCFKVYLFASAYYSD